MLICMFRTTLRLTKSASLQTTGGSSTASSKILGKLDRDFEFEQVAPIKVKFEKMDMILISSQLLVLKILKKSANSWIITSYMQIEFAEGTSKGEGNETDLKPIFAWLQAIA
jgi:hypothetical protein